jgi:hypothetical protein
MTLLQFDRSECIKNFFEYCKTKRNWRVYEKEGLIETERGFHQFILVRKPQIEIFQMAVKYPHSTIQDGFSFRAVRNTFVAMVSFEPLSAAILLFLEEKPGLQSWVGLYDVSVNFQNPQGFYALNLTGSEVFKEFELFLYHWYKLSVEVFPLLDTARMPIQGPELPPPRPSRSLISRIREIRSFPTFGVKREIDFGNQLNPDSIRFMEFAACSNPCCNCVATNYARTRSLLT